MALLSIYNLGLKGVNVDASELHMEDGELRTAQNLIHNVSGVLGGVTNRPGLSRFNTSAAAGSILGGIGVPLANEDGERHIFIGFNGTE